MYILKFFVDMLFAYAIYQIGPWASQSDGLFLCSLEMVLLSCVGVHAAAQLLSDKSCLWRVRCRRAGWTVGLSTASVLTLHEFWQISSDANSTAAIGLVALPFFLPICVACFYYPGWALSFIKTWYTQEHRAVRPLAFGLTALMALTAIAGVIEGVDSYRQHLLIGNIASLQSAELHTVLQDPWASKKRWVLNAVACNPRTSQKDLLRIAQSSDPELHERGRPHLVSDACNHKGLAVMRLVALHPNVGVDALELLSHSQNEYVLNSVVENMKTPEEAVDRIKGMANMDAVVKSGLDQRASQQAAENRAKGAELRKTPGSALSVAPENPDANASEGGFIKALNQAMGPAQIGCSIGQRAALLDVRKFGNIAACAAHWRAASMWAKKTGVRCGKSVACAVPADACALGWHVCGNSSQGVAELRTALSGAQCAGLSTGRFLAALNDTDCGGCASNQRQGAVCCGLECFQDKDDCVWRGATAWAKTRGVFNNSCGEVEMFENEKSGVLCCSDVVDAAPNDAQAKHRKQASAPLPR